MIGGGDMRCTLFGFLILLFSRRQMVSKEKVFGGDKPYNYMDIYKDN